MIQAFMYPRIKKINIDFFKYGAHTGISTNFIKFYTFILMLFIPSIKNKWT